jgi:outer membrane protein TolC
MGVGGAVVAAAYQAQSNEQRDQLAAPYNLSVGVAKERLALVTKELETIQRKVAAGMASNDELLDARVKFAEAEWSLKLMQSFFEEVRATGREPLNGLSSPLVSGRDFVTERLSAAVDGTKVALDIEMKRMQDAQTKVEIGVADRYTTAVAQASLVEVQVRMETLQQKLSLRQKFVKAEMDAVQTELRVLEAEAEGRIKALKPKIELARQQVDQTEKLVKLGATQSIELAEAKLRLQQREADIAKAELDLAIVRKKLSGKD